MRRFILKHIILPFSGNWLKGIFLLLIWTLSFIALPAISGWFLASCSLAFLTANALFSYMAPAAIIRFIAILRTASRYFERLENHKTTLDAQRSLQLKIFNSVARLPYFKKQVNNNASILENSTYGIDQILNHVLLWFLPFASLAISLIIYTFFLNVYATEIAIQFIVSSAILLFIIPQSILIRNKLHYSKLKKHRESNNQDLIQSFRGRIEISKYNLEEQALTQQEKSRKKLDALAYKLQRNSFSLQTIVGFGFSCIATFILWNSSNYGFDAPLAIGIFFGIMAQAELSEMLFSGKSEKSSVSSQIQDIDTILSTDNTYKDAAMSDADFESLALHNIRACIPETEIIIDEVSLTINKGEWLAIYGETGKGKTTLLNSLFYPEYRRSGHIKWNNNEEIMSLPVPQCIYVSQKAYLLTGTLGENFKEYEAQEIIEVLKMVDLEDWFLSLPQGLDSWLGENGETLSGGQRKKMLLAQAMLKKPQLLVIDEPTAGISTQNAISIFRAIKHMHPELSLIMSTHLKDFELEVDKIVSI